jgi:hypothetical protein
MLRRFTASCDAFVHLLQLYSLAPSFSGLVYLGKVKIIVKRKSSLSPAQTAGKRVVSSRFPRLCPQLKTNIKHRVDCARHIPTFFTSNVTLELSGEGLMNDAVA